MDLVVCHLSIHGALLRPFASFVRSLANFRVNTLFCAHLHWCSFALVGGFLNPALSLTAMSISPDQVVVGMLVATRL